MISEMLLAHMNDAAADMFGWGSVLDEEKRALLLEPEVAEEVNKLSYLDYWQRVDGTASLMLKVIGRFNRLGDIESARFWIESLDEELGNDARVREDVIRAFGSEVAFEHALGVTPATPPTLALLGYFEAQATIGDPRLLIVLQLLQKWHAVTMEKILRDGVEILWPKGSLGQTPQTETEKAAFGTCKSYIDANFEESDLATLLWSIDFSGLSLRESQAWIASGVIGRRA